MSISFFHVSILRGTVYSIIINYSLFILHCAAVAAHINDHLRDDRRSNESGEANGVTITAAVKARHCQRALPA